METGNISQDIVSSENKTGSKAGDYNDSSDCVRSSPDNDCDTDSTIVYALDIKDDKFDIALDSPPPEETYFPTSKSVSSDLRPFSPLPSTSRDSITIYLNNTRFNEASGLSTSSPNSPAADTLVPLKDEVTDNTCSDNENQNTPNLSNKPVDVIECSSGSENSNSALIVIRDKNRRSKRKKKSSLDVIDLLLDDVDTKIYDSDCEIIDVDLLIAQNNAVLNSHQPQEVIQLDDTAPEPRTPEWPPAGPTPLPEPSTPSEGLYTSPLMKHLSSFVKMRMQVKDFFDKHSPVFTPKNTNKDSPSLSSSVFDVMSSMIKIPFNYENRKGKKRERKDKSSKNKRPRVLETIDLDSIRSPHQQRSSEVIVIDSETSINVSRSSNADSPSISNLNPYSRPHVQSFKGRKMRLGRSQHSTEGRGCREGHEGHNALLASNRSTIPQIIRTMELISPDNSLLNVMSSLAAPPSVASDPVSVDRPLPSAPSTPSKNYGECPVCMESLQKRNTVSTFCGHIFCETCIKTVKLTSKKCPACRKTLRGKGYHQIFL